MRNHVAALAVVLALLVLPGEAAKKNYAYYRLGVGTDIGGSTTAGTVLMGGGTDVDEAFLWMCSRAGSGDFLVLRATGTDAYNPYIRGLCPTLNSVSTLIVPTAAGANDPFVVNAIQEAEAIWIAGGDQSNYVTYWKGTLLQSELDRKVGLVPLGGTSAGMMVLTQFIYSALGSQGATSSQALADPFNRYITLTQGFVAIPGLANTIGDSHFVTRDRMGRTLAFMSRIAEAGWYPKPRAIAVDEETALLITGTASVVVGNGAAYFFAAPGPAQICKPKTPLTYADIAVYRIPAGGQFHLESWTGTGGTAYTVSANAGVLSSTGSGGSIY